VRRTVAPALRVVKDTGSGEQGHDLVLLGEAPLALLREHERPFRDDVVLAPLALDREGLVSRLGEHGRETRGPEVVAVSDRAVEDLDAHDVHVIARSS